MLISFIIPAYNSEKTIAKCLESVLAQDVKKEVIAVDNNSTDSTAKIIKKYNVKYVFEKKEGEPCARNAGLNSAKGNYIAFVDSDVVLPANWAKKALDVIASEKHVAGVGGLGLSADKGVISEVIGSRIYGIDKSVDRKYVDSLATMNLLLRRESIGNERYDESMVLGVDTEFNMRLRKKGWKMLFDRRLSVKHYHPTSMRGVMRKWYTYGKNYPYMCTKHREFIGKGFFAKALYMPLLILSAAGSLLFQPLIVVPTLQILALFLFYSYIGIKVSKGRVLLTFPFIQTLKQLAHLWGVMTGLRRMF
ncbi:MAG: glycosyltransferase [Candidatus Aenigmarchaeota archaeon]|nr:glycosyltransferase [Candidatus Aenigmarchaeota archaeon]